MKTKRILAFLLSLVMVLSILPTNIVFADIDPSIFADGTGTESDPYQIATLAQLEAFRDSVNKKNTYSGQYIRLAVDIDMSETYNSTSGASWSAIGQALNNHFAGTFDGNGHKITGLYVNDNYSYAGLFGYVKGTVKNLGVSGSVTGKQDVAGIAGVLGGTVENCYSNVDTSFYDDTGDAAGGIAGMATATAIIRNCYNTGKINAYTDTEQIGGIVGYPYKGARIENNYSIGEVGTSSSQDSGGIAGYGYGVTLSNNYYKQGTTSGTSSAGSTALVWDDMSNQAKYAGWDFENVWVMDTERPLLRSCLEQTGSAVSPYLIYNLAQLEAFRNAVNNGNDYKGKYVKLTADIDMSEKYGEGKQSWTPIGNDSNRNFNGNFDGNGHEIKNLYINKTGTSTSCIGVGFFGYLGTNGTVENLAVSGKIAGYMSVGGIVGYNEGAVKNCCNLCEISCSYRYAGGIVGQNYKTVAHCYNGGNVTETGDARGAIAGFTQGWVTDCYFLTGTANGGVGQTLGTGTKNVTSKTTEELKNGSVAWLLQNGQATQAWGQTLGTDNTPVLTSDSDKKVNKITFMQKDGESTFKEYAVKYANKKLAKADFPDNLSTDENRDFWWSENKDKVKFDENTELTKDMTVYAMSGEITEASDKSDTITLNKNKETEIDLSEYVQNKSGNEKNFAFELVDEQTLPDGLEFEKDENHIGKITGTPTKLGYYTVKFNVANNGISLMSLNNIDGVDVLTLNIDVDLEGEGTETNPYLINDLNELEYFRDRVNGGESYEGRYVKLMNDIDATSLSYLGIGKDASHTFAGTFDGNNKTLKIALVSTEQYVAPFPHIGGATIKNLTVTGTVKTTHKFAAGIVGRVESGNAKLENCLSFVEIDSTNYTGVDGTHGGLLAVAGEGSTTTVNNCGFAGSIIGNTTTSCGGIVGWAGATVKISNSFVAAKFELKNNSGDTFARNQKYVTVTNCYYLNALSDAMYSGATQATADEFASGEVAYHLQGTQETQIWGQKIGTDTLPTFSTAKVYEDTYNSEKIYRNEIDGNKIFSLGADKKSATVLLDKAGTYTIVFADYEDNQLANSKTFKVTVDKAQAVRVTSDKDFTLGTGDKIMLWDNFENLTPMCEAYEVK